MADLSQAPVTTTIEEQPKISVQEFSKKVKEKYPDYADVDDVVLAQKMVEKYPEYKERVQFDKTLPETTIPKQQEQVRPQQPLTFMQKQLRERFPENYKDEVKPERETSYIPEVTAEGKQLLGSIPATRPDLSAKHPEYLAPKISDLYKSEKPTVIPQGAGDKFKAIDQQQLESELGGAQIKQDRPLSKVEQLKVDYIRKTKGEKQAIKAENEIRDNKYGFGGELVDQLQSGGESLLAATYATPGNIYDLIGAGFRGLGIPVPEWRDAIAKETKFGGVDVNPLSFLSKQKDALVEMAKANDAEVRKANPDIDKGIVELFKKGDKESVLSGFRNIASSIAQSLPSTIAMMSTGGMSVPTQIGLGAAVFGSQNMNEADYNKDYGNVSRDALLAINSVTGSFESAFETILGSGAVGKGIINLIKSEGKDVAEKEIKKGILESFSTLVIEHPWMAPFGEAFEEMGTQLSQNIVNKYTGYKPDINVTDGVWDSGVVGFVMGTGFSGAAIGAKNLFTKQQPTITTATIEGQQYTVNNPEELGKGGSAIFITAEDGTVRAVNNLKINDVVTQTPEEIELANQQAFEQQALMQGIDPNAQVIGDETNNFGNGQVRIVEFNNGQSKIFTSDGQEHIINNEEEASAFFDKLFSGEQVVDQTQPEATEAPKPSRKIITQKFGGTSIDIAEDEGFDEVIPNDKVSLDKALPALERKFKGNDKFELKVEKEEIEIPGETKYDSPVKKVIVKSIKIVPKATPEQVQEVQNKEVDQKNIAHNKLVNTVNDYNSLSDAARRKVNTSDIARMASELDYAIKTDTSGKLIVLDKGKPIGLRGRQKSTEEIQGHKSLPEYDPDVRETMSHFLTPMAIQDVELGGLQPQQVKQAILDIQSGKKTVAANDLLDAIENIHNTNLVVFKANRKTGFAGAEIPLDEFKAIMNEEVPADEINLTDEQADFILNMDENDLLDTNTLINLFYETTGTEPDLGQQETTGTTQAETSIIEAEIPEKVNIENQIPEIVPKILDQTIDTKQDIISENGNNLQKQKLQNEKPEKSLREQGNESTIKGEKTTPENIEGKGLEENIDSRFRTEDKSYIQETIDELESIAPNAAPVVIIRSMDDVPTKVKEDPQFNDNIEAFWYNGSIYIFPGMVKSRDHLIEIWIHENGLHHGIRNIIPARDMRLFMNRVYDSFFEIAKNNPEFEGIFKRVEHDYRNSSKQARAEEFLAYLSEKVVNEKDLTPMEQSMWNKYLNLFRDFLKRLFNFNSNLLTERQIIDITRFAVQSNFQTNEYADSNTGGNTSLRPTESNNASASEGRARNESDNQDQVRTEQRRLTISDQAKEDLKTRHNALDAITRIGSELNIPIQVVNSSEVQSGNDQLVFTDNGTVNIVSDRVKSVSDVIKSLVKEVASTKGLREMLAQSDQNSIIGKQLAKFDELADNEMNSDKMAQIIRKAFRLTSNQFTNDDLREIVSRSRKQEARFRAEDQSQIVQDARKYNSFEDFVDAYKDAGFRDSHSAPRFDDTPTEEKLDSGGDFSLIEVANGFHNQPNDYFTPRIGARYYGYDDLEGMQSYTAISNIIRAIKAGINDKTITSYRAIPKELKVNKLIDGDWVTFSKEYAIGHGESRFGEKEYKIIKQEVNPKDLWWDGNDINEWGYDTGETQSLGRSDLKKIWDEVHGEIRFRILGETGAANLDKAEEATTRIDNLNVAREMETSGKDAKTIRLATGWEKGVDGKWRYEVPEGKMVSGRVGHWFLPEIYEDTELYAAYPQIRDLDIVIARNNSRSVRGSFNGNVIHIYADDLKQANSTLNHEIQHAIQEIEGFAKGGNTETAIDKYYEKTNARLSEISKELDKYSSGQYGKYNDPKEYELKDEYDRLMAEKMKATPYDQYKRLAGETESRNVQTRLSMTPEERRNTLLQETEDVAREDQIVLMDGLGVSNLESEQLPFTSYLKSDDVKTGHPVTLTYLKNTEKAPYLGSRFGQDVEPTGFYFIQKEHDFPPSSGWVEGKITLKNPLVIPLTDENMIEYKRELSKKYKGKKNKALSNAIKADGYDGIITTKDGYLGEMIKFDFDPSEAISDKIEQQRSEVNTEPTEAQKEAGNYKKGHVRFDGFDISIENPKGSVRSGVNKQGNEWSQVLPSDYGYFRGTTGRDKDHVDVFIGDNPESDKIYVVDQIDPSTGKFDEHKVMLGFNNITKAKQTYLAAFNEGWQGLKQITRTDKQGLKEWFEKGDQKKPFAENVVRFRLPETITIDGKERSTLNSKGLPIAQTEEGIRNFYRWFGDSKVVDKDGRPLVVYHGTNAVFDKFEKGEFGFHFGTQSQANSIEGVKSIIPVYLKFKNPVRIKDLDLWNGEDVAYELENQNIISNRERLILSENDYLDSDVKDLMSKIGYDGIIYLNRAEFSNSDNVSVGRDRINLSDEKFKEKYNASDSYIAFNPSQIKSATGNTGSFSSESNDIRFRIAEENPFDKLFIDLSELASTAQSKERLEELDAAQKEAKRAAKEQILKQIQGYKEGYRAGTNEMKLRLKLIQGNIISYANKNMPYSEAGKRSITSLLTAIKNASTPATIEDAFNKIDELTEKINKKTVIAQIEKILKKNRPKKVDGKSAGRLDPDIYKVLKKIREIVDLKSDEEFEKFASNLNEEDVESVALFGMFSNLENKTEDEAKEALAQLSGIVTEGKVWYKEEMKKRKEYLDGIRSKVMDKVTGGRPHMTQQDYIAAGTVPKDNFLNNYVLANQSLEWLLDIASKDKSEQAGEGWMQIHFGDLLNESTNKETKGIREAVELVNKAGERIFGAKENALARIFTANSKVVDNTGVTFTTNEGRTEIPLSQNQAAKRWMEMQDPTLKGTFDKMGWDEQSLTELESFMTPQVKQWAEWQLNEFYPEYFKATNEAFRNNYFVDMPFNPKYSPIRREVIQQNNNDGELLQGSTMLNSVMSGSFISRIANINNILLQDANTVLFNHISEMEHFKAWIDSVKEMRSTLGSRDVQHAIKFEHGNKLRQEINNQINDFASGGSDKANVITLVDKIRGNFAVGELALNLSLYPKQAISILTFLADVPINKYAEGLVDMALNIKSVIDMMKSSEFIKERYLSGWNYEVRSALKKETPEILSNAKSRFNEYKNKLMFPAQFGDYTSAIGGWTVYKYNYEKQLALELLKPGITQEQAEENARKEAMTRYERSSARLLQSSALKDAASIQKGSFGKMFTMFKSQPQLQQRYESAGWRNLLRNRGSKAHNIKLIALFHVLLPVAFQAMANMFTDDDDDEKLKRLLIAGVIGSLNGFLIASDVIEFIIEKAMGSPFDYSLSPLEGSVNKIGTGATSVVKGIKNEEGDQEAANDQIFKGIDQIAYGINNIAVGLPYRPSKKIIKQVGEVVNPEGAKSTEVEKLGKKILFEQYKFNHELNKVSDEDREKMLSDTTLTGIMNDISVIKSEITQRKADIRDAKNLNNSMEEDTRQQILNEYPQIIDSLYRDVVEKYKDFDFPKSYKPKK